MKNCKLCDGRGTVMILKSSKISGGITTESGIVLPCPRCNTKLIKRKKKKKFEVCSIMAHSDHITDSLTNAQNEGWQIAGDILLKNESGHCNDTYVHVPMKRKIKTPF